MARLIELLKQQTVPAGVMRSAARGALNLPPTEMLEVLVFLTSHPEFGGDARATLSACDSNTCNSVLKDATAPREVLHYFLAPRNRRLELLPALIANPAIPTTTLAAIAETGSHQVAGVLLESDRVWTSTDILKSLLANPNLPPERYEGVSSRLSELGVDVAAEIGTVTDVAVLEWLREHAAELAAEEAEAKPFSLIGGIDELGGEEPEVITESTLKAKSDDERISTLQKLARMTVGERIKVAMMGNKEERSILIRDGSKLVSSAVLASPKLSEQEVETFANMKNVRENVLREIARSHRFLKNYVVVRNLCSNPRTPLDLSLKLIKNLLVPDLRSLSMNKNVPETLRRMSQKLYRIRTSPSGKAE